MREHPETGPRLRKPQWLRRKLPTGPEYERVRSLLKDGALHTVCQEAKCPNQWECFSCKTATFLIMGPRCTRNCRFCAVEHGPLSPPDPGEPARVAEAAFKLGLRYVVVTSVTRDDLEDGGASFFTDTIRQIRDKIPDAQIEVLIPDFQGQGEALRKVVEARPDVLNHNIETVPRLYPSVRPGCRLPPFAGPAETCQGLRSLPPHQVRSDAGPGRNARGNPGDPSRFAGCGVQLADAGSISATLGRASARGALRSSRRVRKVARNGPGNGVCSGGQWSLRAKFLPCRQSLPERRKRQVPGLTVTFGFAAECTRVQPSGRSTPRSDHFSPDLIRCPAHRKVRVSAVRRRTFPSICYKINLNQPSAREVFPGPRGCLSRGFRRVTGRPGCKTRVPVHGAVPAFPPLHIFRGRVA